MQRAILSTVIVLSGISAVLASSADFRLRGVGIELGKMEEVYKDGQPLPPRFVAKGEVGKPFTLFAHGVVLPRGGAASPGEPDCGAWLFDDAVFKLLPHEKDAADKSALGIQLQPTVAGQTRIRFVGRILGYDRKFDILLEVAPAAAK